MFLFCNVYASADDIFDLSEGIELAGVGPGNRAAFAAFGKPVVFMGVGKISGLHLVENLFYLFFFFFQEQEIPKRPSRHLAKRITRQRFTRPIKAHDMPLVIQPNNQRLGRVHNRIDKAAFFYQGYLGLFL